MSAIRPFRAVTAPTRQALEARVATLEAHVARLQDALGYAMQTLTQEVTSPIIGGPTTKVSLLDLYRARVTAATPDTSAPTEH